MRNLTRGLVVGGVVAASVMAFDVGPSGVTVAPREAQAVVGRPLTPISYAGVARRTVRRSYYGPNYYRW